MACTSTAARVPPRRAAPTRGDLVPCLQTKHALRMPLQIPQNLRGPAALRRPRNLEMRALLQALPVQLGCSDHLPSGRSHISHSQAPCCTPNIACSHSWVNTSCVYITRYMLSCSITFAWVPTPRGLQASCNAPAVVFCGIGCLDSTGYPACTQMVSKCICCCSLWRAGPLRSL